jgi:hypothetical protein
VFQNRWFLHLLTTAAALQVGLAAGGIQGWQCPIHSTVGIPCPGCGLSSATASLIQGEWRVALQIHFFAPVFVMGFIFMGIFSVLPGQVYHKSLRWLDAFERSTGFATLLSIALVVYWCYKILGLILR